MEGTLKKEESLRKNIKEIIKDECQTLGLEYYDSEEEAKNEASELERMKKEVQVRQQTNQLDLKTRQIQH